MRSAGFCPSFGFPVLQDESDSEEQQGMDSDSQEADADSELGEDDEQEEGESDDEDEDTPPMKRQKQPGGKVAAAKPTSKQGHESDLLSWKPWLLVP